MDEVTLLIQLQMAIETQLAKKILQSYDIMQHFSNVIKLDSNEQCSSRTTKSQLRLSGKCTVVNV